MARSRNPRIPGHDKFDGSALKAPEAVPISEFLSSWYGFKPTMAIAKGLLRHLGMGG